MFITYILRKDDGQAFYVGAGKENRPRMHIGGYGGIPAVLDVINEHEGRGSSVIVEVESIHNNKDSAFSRESKLIKEIGRKDLNKGPLVNLTDGGPGVCGMRVSDANIERMSKTQKERFKNPEEREKLSIATKKGMRSREVREKCRNGIIKAWSNPDYRAHQVLVHTGKVDSDKTRMKKSESLCRSWASGKRLGKYTDDQVKIIYDLKGVKTPKEAAEIYGMNPTYVSKIWRQERCRMALKRLGYLNES